MPNTVLGKVSVVPKGDYSASTTYYALDIAGYQGGSYLAMKEVTGVTPSNDGVNWMQLSGPGLPGVDGVTFTPSVSKAGVISWTNDGGEENPDPVDIMGPPGAAAGFGTVTATADNTSSETPSVDVQASGPDTAKNFTFAFTGLKGNPGDTPDIEIGTVTTLEPGQDATAGITGTTPNLSLSLGIPKGQPGTSVSRIERTSGTGAAGTTDTYTMYDSNNEPIGTFTVYNGANGSGAGDFKADGSVPMAGNLQMGGNRITGVGAPTDPSDAVRQQDLEVVSQEVDHILDGTTPAFFPLATEAKAGAVKPGAGMSVEEDGTLNAEAQGAAFSVTIPADGWGEGDTATVQSPMFAASGYAYVCGPDEDSRSGWAAGGVRAADEVSADGALAFLCDQAPETDLTVNIIRTATVGSGSPVLSTGGGGSGGGGGGIKLLSITVTTPPNKTAYRPGDVFDPSGMVITASYEFGLEQAVTGYTYTPSGALAEGNTQITISYSEGGVTAQTTQAITVEKATVQVPSQSGTLTYTGEEQFPVWDNYSQADMTLGGETSGTNAGSYEAVFTLTNTVGTQWPDGTTEPKTAAWNIQKAAGQVTLNPESLILTADQPSGTVTVTRLGTGAITAQVADTSVASAQVSGDQVTVTGLETGITTVTVSAADDGNYTAGSASLSVQVQLSEIYGVEWDGTGTTVWSRTDAAELFTDPEPAVNNGTGSSPFDDIMPWSGMVTSEDPETGTVVSIPKFWYKWTRSGNGMKLQISNGPEDGFFVSPAHADRGDGYGERDVVYVGRYHCGSSYKSQTGVQPVTNITRSTARVSIHALGDDVYQWDWATRWTIMMLYLVEYANWNSQAAIGYGCSPSGNKFNMGLTDAMQYHTGTSAASRTTYGCCQYRHIEGLWDNVYDWVDGIYFSGANVYCILNPDDYSDTTGGTLVGQRATNSGWISAWTDPSAVDGYEWALYPDAVNGSKSTFVTDYCNYFASGVVLRVGGYYYQGQDRGLFCAFGDYAASDSSSDVGSRLHKLPKGEGV